MNRHGTGDSDGARRRGPHPLARAHRLPGAAVVALGLIAAAPPLRAEPYPAPGGPRAIDVGAVHDHIAHLTRTLGARPADSSSARWTAEYIERTLNDMGHQVRSREVGEVSVPAVGAAGFELIPPRQLRFSDRNLWLAIAPRDDPAAGPASGARPAMVLMGHYDSVQGSPGAVDNAVAVAVLLELARVLVREPPPRPVILAWTAAEERGLAGAHALATILTTEPGPPIGLAVSIDLAGSAGQLTLNGLGPRIGTDWLRWIAGAVDAADVAVDAPIPHRVVSRLAPGMERSDHGAFTHRGIPAFHLYSRGDDPVFLPYHTAFDTLEAVDTRSVADLARLVPALVYRVEPFPESSDDAGLWLAGPGGPRVLPGWLLRTVEASLLGWIVFTSIIVVRRRWRQRDRGPGLLLATLLYAAGWLAAAGLLAAWARVADHPRPWVHDPARAVWLAVVVAVATVALAVVALPPRRVPVGRDRYLLAALAMLAAMGAALLIGSAPELAWIPLVPAAAWCVLVHVRRPWWALVVYAAGLLPLLAPLAAGFLRESVFHGFFKPGFPLAGYLAAVLLPAALTLAYALRRFAPAPSPRARRAIAAGAVVALAAAAAVLLSTTPPCPGDQYRTRGLSCEVLGDDSIYLRW